MSLREKIQERQIAAMKAKEKELLEVLRLLMSSIKNEEIETKKELSDEEVQAVAGRQVKQLQDALKDFIKGGREDLVVKTKSEIEIISEYLPEQLSDDKLDELTKKAIAEVQASGPQDIGKVMGVLMKEVKGRADGNRVREVVAKNLSV
jgi:uncharacterized protein YqeY